MTYIITQEFSHGNYFDNNYIAITFVKINLTYVLSVYPKIVHLVEFAGHRYTGLPYIRA